MDARQSIKRLLKGKQAPSYHKRLSHVRNKSSLAGGAGGSSSNVFGMVGGSGSGSFLPVGNMSDDALGGLLGDDFSREQLLRIVHKEVIEKPAEQEVLFVCAVHKGMASKYNIGGLVGAAGGERSRFLCVALEIGSRPGFAPAPRDADDDEEDGEGDRPLSVSGFTAGGSTSGAGSSSASSASPECFVVVYYFTVAAGGSGSEVHVTIKSDVYLNDLLSVEYGSGADFTLVFEQEGGGGGGGGNGHNGGGGSLFQLAAPSQSLRDEVVWNLLTIADVFGRVQPETRSVDLHGLSMTASTQNFLSRNEALGRFMTLALEYENKGKVAGGSGGGGRAGGGGGGMASQSVLMDPFLSSHVKDEEVEAMLDKFNWPAQTVDDIDAKLLDQLKQLERETIEVLLSWETTAKEQAAAASTPALPSIQPPAPAPGKGSTSSSTKSSSSKGSSTAPAPPPPPPPVASVGGEGDSKGYLSTLELVDMLDVLAGELEVMETWLSSKGDALTLMQTDMLEIEAENNRMERQWKNYTRLNAVLKPVVLELSLDPDSERVLRNPAKQLDIPGVLVIGGSSAEQQQQQQQQQQQKESGLSDSQTSALVSERVSVLVSAAKRLQHALALLEGRDLPENETSSNSSNNNSRSSGLEAGFNNLSLNPYSPSSKNSGLPSGPIKVLLPPALGMKFPPPSSTTATTNNSSSSNSSIKPLKVIPRRLMAMESLRSQSSRYGDVRSQFLERATKYLSLLFPKCVKPETLLLPLSSSGGQSGGNSAMLHLLSPQGLGNFQRLFHTRLLDYEPLLEVVVQMLQDVTAGPALLDDLLHAYSDAGNLTLYKPLLKAYFAQLHARVVGSGGGGGSGSSSMLGASIGGGGGGRGGGDGTLSPPLNLSGITSAAMASLPRAHINDFGAHGAVALPPPSSSFRGGKGASPLPYSSGTSDVASYYQQQASLLQQGGSGGMGGGGGGGGMAPSLAIGQALTQLVPLVKKEQIFVTELFKLKPGENEEDHRKLQSVLEVEFDKLREKLTEQAEAATEGDPLEGLAILAVMTQTLDPSSGSSSSSSSSSSTGGRAGMGAAAPPPPSTGLASEDRFMSELLLSLQQSLATKFNRFISEQDAWISHHSPDIKRAGVLAPFAKFPIFVDRLALAVRGRPIDIANAALQKLPAGLLAWLERIAQKRDPKYADVVRLENYHFFVQTMSPRQQRLVGSSALTPYIDQAQACHEAAVQRYVAWSLEYEFPQLTAFFVKLEELIVKVGVGDVSIHVPKAALLKLMQEPCSRKAVAEGLTTAFRRVRKHISDDSGLFLPLWDRITALLSQRFARYEEIALRCYDVKLEPSANLVRQLAQECRSQGGK